MTSDLKWNTLQNTCIFGWYVGAFRRKFHAPYYLQYSQNLSIEGMSHNESLRRDPHEYGNLIGSQMYIILT